MRVARNVLIGAGLIALALLGWNYLIQPETYQKTVETDVKVSEALIGAGQPQKALELLKGHASQIDTQTDAGKAWLSLLIDAYSDTDNLEALLFLYGRFPEVFDRNELAAQRVADSLLKEKEWESYADLRAHWQGKEKAPVRWFFLDSEAHSIQGNSIQAASLLTSRSFTGKEETERLVRLALLHLVEDPKLSWNYLSEASIKDPENADLNQFKATLLDSVGKNQMAIAEYIQAIQKAPHNVYLREQLADAYIKEGNYGSAMEILEDAMLAPSTDTAWLKGLFWSRMMHPLKGTWKSSEIPSGSLSPLVTYVFSLPKNVYWNSNAFEKTPEMGNYLKTRQETYWLRLVEALKKGNEHEAEVLLKQNPFYTVSWQPSIENSLKAVLSYRKLRQQHPEDSLPVPQIELPKSSSLEQETDIAMHLSKQQFKETLQELYQAQTHGFHLPAIPQDIDQLLMSKEAFAAVFLAYEWQEAALQLHKLHIIAPDSPDWVVYSLTQAMKNNRDIKTALQFASPQKNTPETSLLIAELAQSLGLFKTAQEELLSIYKRKDNMGYAAAHQLSQLYLKQNNSPAAKEIIINQPLLADSVRGKEMLARIAILENNSDVAASLYATIQENSPEAKSFLARKAYLEKDWKRAKQFAEELLALHPENAQLQENLQRIILEQQRSQ